VSAHPCAISPHLANVQRGIKMSDAKENGIEIKKRNTAWVITASAPLLRPGLSISITVSEKYVTEETAKLLSKVREINEAG